MLLAMLALAMVASPGCGESSPGPGPGPGTDGDPCAEVGCGAHGACRPPGVCVCERGYAGDVCDRCDPAVGFVSHPGQPGTCIEDPCAPDPCAPHGTCSVDASATALCACEAGWTGTTCGACAEGYLETDDGHACVDDPCLPDPCAAPPPPTCEGAVQVVYEAPATCTATSQGATCAWTSRRNDCAEGGGTCTAGACTAPVHDVGPHLADPATMIPFVEDCARFWTGARDDAYGGFHTWVGRDGSPDPSRGKAFVTQSRNAYGFARAFMLTGDAAWLEHAEHALAFLYAHGWDAENGGWFFSSDRSGTPTPLYADWDPNGWKWTFVQHYALLGIAAMCEVTGAPVHCDRLVEGAEVLDAHLWDDDTDLFGYFQEADLDWSDPRGKGFTATVDAVTTHALALTLLDPGLLHSAGPDPRAGYRARLLDLADLMADRLVASLDDPAVQVGFVESFGSDWSVDTEDTGGSVGHALKTGWCLARADLLAPGRGYAAAGRRIVRAQWETGYDHVHGGPFTEFDWATGAVDRDEKDWWMLEQAVTAGLLHYALAETPEDRRLSLEMADASLEFFMAHLVDPVHGEVFSRTSADGATVTDPAKGTPFKAGYHAIELGYYVYLYGRLFLHRAPVTLHYRFERTDEARDVRLTPLAVGDAALRIRAVALDGAPYEAFDAAARRVRIPAGTGGTFAVTFEPVE